MLHLLEFKEETKSYISKYLLKQIKFRSNVKVHTLRLKYTIFTIFTLTGIYLFKVNNGEHQNNVWHLFKVNEEDTRTTSNDDVLNFEQILNIVLLFPMLNLEK